MRRWMISEPRRYTGVFGCYRKVFEGASGSSTYYPRQNYLLVKATRGTFNGRNVKKPRKVHQQVSNSIVCSFVFEEKFCEQKQVV